MTYNDTEQLIQKYLNGETTAEEERLLALEVSHEDAPYDWKIIAGMLGELTVDEALFDQEMASRRQKPCIMRLWPWVAAACVAALLIVFLTPPRDGNWSFRNQEISRLGNQTTKQPNDQTTKRPNNQTTNPQAKVAEVNRVEQKVEEPQITDKKPLLSPKANHRAKVSKGVAKAPQASKTEQVAKPENSEQTLTKVEESDIIPYDDPMIQFAEQAKALRERGNRVNQRVSMNTIVPDNYQL